jgi:hypothetical protein
MLLRNGLVSMALVLVSACGGNASRDEATGGGGYSTHWTTDGGKTGAVTGGGGAPGGTGAVTSGGGAPGGTGAVTSGGGAPGGTGAVPGGGGSCFDNQLPVDWAGECVKEAGCLDPNPATWSALDATGGDAGVAPNAEHAIELPLCNPIDSTTQYHLAFDVVSTGYGPRYALAHHSAVCSGTEMGEVWLYHADPAQTVERLCVSFWGYELLESGGTQPHALAVGAKEAGNTVSNLRFVQHCDGCSLSMKTWCDGSLQGDGGASSCL